MATTDLGSLAEESFSLDWNSAAEEEVEASGAVVKCVTGVLLSIAT